MIYIYVACGGALGALLRFVIASLFNQLQWSSLPLGTLAVNVLGSFLLGWAYIALSAMSVSSALFTKHFMMVGLLGALTTFSTFSLDTLTLLEQGSVFYALLNIMANVLCCLLATWLAIWIFKG